MVLKKLSCPGLKQTLVVYKKVFKSRPIICVSFNSLECCQFIVKRLIVVQKTVEELINISSHANFRGFISSE